MIALRTGAQLAAAAVGPRFVIVSMALSAFAIALTAGLERGAFPVRALDHTLVGIVFGVVVPLLGYASVSRATRSGLEAAVLPAARWGLDRRRAALGFLAVLALGVALASAFLSALAVVLAGPTGAAGRLADVMVSAEIGLVGGASYALLFSAGASLRWPRVAVFLLLGADWLLGTVLTAVALPWPRGHLRNLLGAPALLGMPQPQAYAALGVVCVLSLGFAMWRLRR